MKKIFFVIFAHACVFVLWGQGSLQLGAGAHIKSSGGAYIVLDNMNIVNNGTFQQATGDGFIKLTGATDVSLSGGSATSIDVLLLAKTGMATLNLQSNLSVVSNVNFSSGLLNLNNSVLNLGSTGTFINESETSRALTSGSGYIEASGTLNAPASVDLGNLGAVITSSANLGNTTIRRGHAIQTGVFSSNNSIQRYYDIIPTNNLVLKAVLRFYYFDAELNGIPEATLYQWKSKDNINWDFVGADARDITTDYVEKKSINKFDRWTLATATAPTITCPANITISANQNGCKALLSFAATTTGIPSPTIIYRIGNKIITSPYVFPRGTTTVTATASNGILPDASCTFTVTVVCGPVTSINRASEPQQEIVTDELALSVRPNPSSHYFTLGIRSNKLQPVTIKITDILGRVVSVYPNVASNNTLHVGHQFLPGIYFVQAIQGKQIVTIKLIKQNY